jgi:hypothetical protein
LQTKLTVPFHPDKVTSAQHRVQQSNIKEALTQLKLIAPEKCKARNGDSALTLDAQVGNSRSFGWIVT